MYPGNSQNILFYRTKHTLGALLTHVALVVGVRFPGLLHAVPQCLPRETGIVSPVFLFFLALATEKEKNANDNNQKRRRTGERAMLQSSKNNILLQ